MIKKLVFILLFVLITNIAYAINAEWTANPTSENVTKYTLYYKKTNGSTISSAESPTNAISISDNSFEVGVPYSFSVSATNAIGESPKSLEVQYTIPQPPVEDKLEPDDPSGIKITIESPVIVE